MIKLNLSTYHKSLQFKLKEDKRYVWDPIRKSHFVVQPEELVRQSWIQYLILDQNISPAAISVERQLKLNQLKRRFDLVVYHKADAKVLFEFKSFKQKLDNNVAQQVASYNLELQVPFLVISNGMDHFAFKTDYVNNQIVELKDLVFLSDIRN